MHNNKYIKAKLQSYNVNVYGNKSPREGKHYTWFSVMLLYSIVNADKKHQPQMCWEECIYIMKKKVMISINEELILNDDEYNDEYDDEYDYLVKIVF